MKGIPNSDLYEFHIQFVLLFNSYLPLHAIRIQGIFMFNRFRLLHPTFLCMLDMFRFICIGRVHSQNGGFNMQVEF